MVKHCYFHHVRYDDTFVRFVIMNDKKHLHNTKTLRHLCNPYNMGKGIKLIKSK